MFPLRYREGGVLKRVAIPGRWICRGWPGEPGGSLVRNRQRRRDWKHEQITRAERVFQKHDLKMVLISDMIRYRRATEKNSLIERTAVARVPTEHGSFTAVSYVSKVDGIEHVVFVYGDHSTVDEIAESLKENALVRVHSECLTGDI